MSSVARVTEAAAERPHSPERGGAVFLFLLPAKTGSPGPAAGLTLAPPSSLPLVPVAGNRWVCATVSKLGGVAPKTGEAEQHVQMVGEEAGVSLLPGRPVSLC